MWVPSLLFVTDGPLPTGLVFSAFMLALTIGGMLFGLLLPVFPAEAEVSQQSQQHEISPFFP